MVKAYHVTALWDAHASVWVSESDIPGLVIEADTLDAFERLMMQLAPEVLAENEGVHAATVSLRFSARADRVLAVA